MSDPSLDRRLLILNMYSVLFHVITATLLQEESCRSYKHPVLQACYDASGLKLQMYIIFSECFEYPKDQI